MGKIERMFFSFSLIAIIFMLISGCEDKEKAIEERNKAIVRHVHEEVAKGNAAVFDEVLASNYIRHCQAMPPELQELHGTEQFKAFVKDFMKAVPDAHDSIDLMIAEGDKVAYIATTTGTQVGQMGPFPASGKEFTLVNIIIHRLEDGKIAETWVSWDNVAFLTQLGFFPPPGEDNE
ncbi:ester cyclase [candidate division LCP-89 bacterium B3_LCP]|uniref:Ester cyclase n=1 Tax=candidate division LCP-89 bacterium B3_LCP TaxID=2012998 RepID=A0A532UZD1_UNCL8|nr:MAG: ester cyclase [candidate division LCP-89 bacterium B3_LCP]